TTIMYCLWKTKGISIRPWREDVIFGAVQQGDTLKIAIAADRKWKGKIIFDTPRHKTNMNMPLDWPRINQFPEWFTVQSEKLYTLRDLTLNANKIYTGRQLRQGITIELCPGSERRLLILAPPTVKLVKNPSVLQIHVDGNKVLQYNHAPVPPPKGKSKNYTRSGFIHPLWSPAGQVLTQIHPKDHIHHMGIWMPWTNARFEGRNIDFWNLKAGKATVRFKRFLSHTGGPVYGGFLAQHEHVDLTAPQGEKVALNEIWDVRV
ncbi:unnamed protein product, partial [marine sediment metagenome]